MRGIVFTGERAELTDDLEVRPPGPNEVAVRIRAAGVCHSDVSVIDGTIPWPAPAVLGHEGAGVVEEVGSEVSRVKVGDHVVVTTLANCGMCRWCSSGLPTWCRSSMGNMDQPFRLGGEPAYNFAAASVFTERTVVREVQAVPISKEVPFESACLIGCGVVTGVGAVLNRAKVARGDTAAVFGVGGVGLNVIQALAICDATTIVAVDTVAAKEPLARRFGATHFVDATQAGVPNAIRQCLPPGEDGVFNARGVDWAFDCVGHPSAVRDGVESLAWGGSCVILGVPPPGTELAVPFSLMTHVDRGVMGCRYGSVRPHRDVPLIVQLYLADRLLLDELVSETQPLEGFEKVVSDMHEGRLARGVLTLDG
ncbi:MAG TPA: Zn-dependent alcohol dehydrogenase [Acidimicrobiales bacterium]|nr:Zn-dependent alcohol dehydrogenase [Acidimicrobiales bacterium]